MYYFISQDLRSGQSSRLSVRFDKLFIFMNDNPFIKEVKMLKKRERNYKKTKRKFRNNFKQYSITIP